MDKMLLNVDKICIDKELGYEIPDFIYEEARKHAELKQALLIKLGYENADTAYWLIKVIVQYVNQIFDLERYKSIMEG